MTFVLDASVTMAWCFDDDPTEYAAATLRRLAGEDAIAPSVWSLEVTNTLVIAERQKRLDKQRSTEFLHRLTALPIAIIHAEMNEVLDSILTVSRDQGISAYDASYVALALREGIALATVDGGIRSACRRLGVSIVPR